MDGKIIESRQIGPAWARSSERGFQILVADCPFCGNTVNANHATIGYRGQRCGECSALLMRFVAWLDERSLRERDMNEYDARQDLPAAPSEIVR